MLFELYDLKPYNPHINIALDEILCYFLALRQEPRNMRLMKGGLRLWCNPLSIVLGRSNQPEDVLQFLPPSAASSAAVPQIARRISGGGTVLHSPNCLNYSIFLSLNHYPAFFSVQQAYQKLLGMVASCLQSQNIAAELRGTDLAVPVTNSKFTNLMKISGNAQFRKRNILVLHGTLIMQPQVIELIELYLKHPPEEPAYRQERRHRHFLTSLPYNFNIPNFYGCIKEQFKRLTGERHSIPLAIEDRQELYRMADSLAKERYTNRAWIEKGQLSFPTEGKKNENKKNENKRGSWPPNPYYNPASIL